MAVVGSVVPDTAATVVAGVATVTVGRRVGWVLWVVAEVALVAGEAVALLDQAVVRRVDSAGATDPP